MIFADNELLFNASVHEKKTKQYIHAQLLRLTSFTLDIYHYISSFVFFLDYQR